MTKAKLNRSNLYSGAVVANGFECAGVGRKILEQGGSAVDSAIATLFCEGITCPQSMGLGGGFLALVYNRDTQKMEFVNARETAPKASTENMYSNNVNSSSTGGMAMAVPGELKGYWELHQKYGKLPWKTLVQPAIDLCEGGHVVTPYLARILSKLGHLIKKSETLKEIYVNDVTGEVYKEGDIIKRPQLAETLKIVAKEGADALYSKNGSLLSNLVEDIKSFGGIITEEDFLNYNVRWEQNLPKSELIDGHTLYSCPLPGSGPLINFIFCVLNELRSNSKLTWHKIVETFKFAYGERTKLGDPHYVENIDHILENLLSSEYIKNIANLINGQEQTNDSYSYYGANFGNQHDNGTAHVSVLAPNGDAVSVISTINGGFGAMIRSLSTGIILNNEMDDFATPGMVNAFGLYPSPANYICPGKQPLSSMAPTMIVDASGDVRMCIGAAGGAKITLSTVLVILQHFYFKKSLYDSVKQPRMFHYLAPMELQYEKEIDPNILTELKSFGHKLKEIPEEIGFSAVTAITSEPTGVYATFDPRRGGSAEVMKLELSVPVNVPQNNRKKRKTENWKTAQEISVLLC